MKTRQALKIVKNQTIECRRHFQGSGTIRTAGRVNYGKARSSQALRIVFKKQDRDFSNLRGKK